MTLASLRVRGPFHGPTGYDHHVREFVRELVNQGVAVELVEVPEWSPARLPAHLRDPWFDSLDKPTGARVTLHFCMPHQVTPGRGAANVNYTMFEATRISEHWINRGLGHDLIVLPTESSRRAWAASGMPEDRLRVCPLGINHRLYTGSASPLPLRGDGGEPIDQYRVRFLNVSELGPRKNLVGLLRAWMRATSRRDDAALIVKLGCYQPGWQDLFRAQIDALQAELGKRLEEAAPVHFVHHLFSDADMPRMYAAATHYISLSHGEGWDQAMVEAAASGLKLIAPGHSAYTAYLDSSIAQLIPSREVPAVFESVDSLGALFEAANWWEPDEEAAVACVRAAIEGHESPKASARDPILRQFTWEHATRRLIAILDEVETRKNRRHFWSLTRVRSRS